MAKSPGPKRSSATTCISINGKSSLAWLHSRGGSMLAGKAAAFGVRPAKRSGVSRQNLHPSGNKQSFCSPSVLVGHSNASSVAR
eukprot:5219465-Amphidinium_carterae.1